MLDSHSAGEGLGWQDSKLTNRRLSKSVGARTGLVKMRRIGTGLPAGDRWLGDRSADLVFDCDVLIVGGGGAGLRAALAAVESRPEARVIIATKGELDPLRCCTTCTRCTQIMRDGGQTGCTLRDKDIDLPIYRAGIESATH